MFPNFYSWDEWVPNARVLKLTKENLDTQALLKKQHSKTNKKKGSAAKILVLREPPAKKTKVLKPSTASPSTKSLRSSSRSITQKLVSNRPRRTRQSNNRKTIKVEDQDAGSFDAIAMETEVSSSRAIK